MRPSIVEESCARAKPLTFSSENEFLSVGRLNVSFVFAIFVLISLQSSLWEGESHGNYLQAGVCYFNIFDGASSVITGKTIRLEPIKHLNY